MPAEARNRLRVLDVGRRVDDRDRAAELRMIERPHDRHDAAVEHLARADELHCAVVRARQVALRSVEQLELACRPDSSDIDECR